MQVGKALRHYIARNALGQYCVPVESMHRPCAQTVLRGGVWEAATLKAIEAQYTGGDIVTAGTYFGDFLPVLCRLADAQAARVWAFEPVTVNYLCASVTCGLNALTNCTLAHAGLGAEPAELTMRTRDKTGQSLGGGARIVARGHDRPRPGFDTVRITTIDAAVGDRPVGLIQLDTEGHEIAALQGAATTIARWRPLLVLESHGGADLPADPALQDLTARLGYHAIDRQDQNVFLAAPKT
ncbi:MAG: FkbM family methyltransferase [Pararhodobacter sp.]